jgi:hypothetical protein
MHGTGSKLPEGLLEPHPWLHPGGLEGNADGFPLDLVRAALARQLALAGGALTQLAVERTIKRGYSTVVFLRVVSTSGTQRLVAKTAAFHPENRHLLERENQAVVEYKILAQLHPLFQEIEGCSVPRPVLVLPDSGVFLMEFAPGVVLADEFRRTRWLAGAAGSRAVQEHYHRLGRWLNHFQNFTRVPDASSDSLTETLRLCELWLGCIERWGDRRCGSEWSARVRQRLGALSRELAGVKIPVAGRHGDFGPWNVLAAPDRVVVLDFLGYAIEPVPIDPLRMLLVLEDERKCLTASPRRIDALRESFLAGYAPWPEVPAPALVLCEAFQRIRTVYEYLAKRLRWPHQRLGRRRCLTASRAWLAGESRELLWPH